MTRSAREERRKRGERVNMAVAAIAFAIVLVLVIAVMARG